MSYRILSVTLLAAFVSAVFTSTGSAQLASAGSARSSHPPGAEDVAFAQRTSDLLLNTLFAALTQEFDETTADNVEEGKLGGCADAESAHSIAIRRCDLHVTHG